MKDEFPGTRLLWALLSIAVISLAGIGVLYAFDLPSKIEAVLYYTFFVLLFVAAISYNILSLQKGRWLAGELKKKFKAPK